MVQVRVQPVAERLELAVVEDEAVLVQGHARQFDPDGVVVAVDPTALVALRQAVQLVAG